jgi:hypothetical protein
VRLVITVDPQRWKVAIHELGHYVVWSELPKARIVSVEVTGYGEDVTGCVRVKWPRDTPELDRGYLVGLLAGREADRHQARLTRTRHDTSGCGHDLALFRRTRRLHPPSRAWSEQELRAEALCAVRARWAQIQRLAPILAHRGSL